MILQEGMDSTIQRLSELQQVRSTFFFWQSLAPLISAIQNQGIADEATNAQIDTLILDNRKKLNQIIGMFYTISHCTQITELFFQTPFSRPACRRSMSPSTSSSRQVKLATKTRLQSTPSP